MGVPLNLAPRREPSGLFFNSAILLEPAWNSLSLPTLKKGAKNDQEEKDEKSKDAGVGRSYHYVGKRR